MTNQVAPVEDWKPAEAAPFDQMLMTRFERDGAVIERKMVRLLPRLWWDDKISGYAHETPFAYTELEGGKWA